MKKLFSVFIFVFFYCMFSAYSKKKLFLHFGPHKTASTYVQNFLFNNKKTLKGYKIIYIGNPQISSTHTGVSFFSNSPKKNKEKHIELFKKLIDDFTKEKDADCDVIFSYEGLLGQHAISKEDFVFYPRYKECIDFISAALSDFEVIPIFIIRSQEEYLDSYIMQLLNENRLFKMSIPKYLESLKNQEISWRNIIEYISLKISSPVLIDFRLIKRDEKSILKEFIKIIEKRKNIQIYNLNYNVENKEKNISISHIGVKIFQFLSPILSDKLRQKLRYFLQRNLNNKTYSKKNFISTEGRKFFYNKYKKDNELLLAQGALKIEK